MAARYMSPVDRARAKATRRRIIFALPDPPGVSFRIRQYPPLLDRIRSFCWPHAVRKRLIGGMLVKRVLEMEAKKVHLPARDTARSSCIADPSCSRH